MTRSDVERRLIALEEAMELLKNQVTRILDLVQTPLDPKADGELPGQPWYVREAGRFKDDPIFDEIVRLGREYRESLPLDEEFEEDKAS